MTAVAVSPSAVSRGGRGPGQLGRDQSRQLWDGASFSDEPGLARYPTGRLKKYTAAESAENAPKSDERLGHDQKIALNVVAVPPDVDSEEQWDEHQSVLGRLFWTRRADQIPEGTDRYETGTLALCNHELMLGIRCRSGQRTDVHVCVEWCHQYKG